MKIKLFFTILLVALCGTQQIASAQCAGFSASATITNNVRCFGGGDGGVRLQASGGTSPYSYVWSNGYNLAVQNGLSAGIYTATVTDAIGCSIIVNAVVLQPTRIQHSQPVIVQPLLCAGANNGRINIDTVRGGTPPYTYDWVSCISSGSPTIATYAENLISLEYTVVMTDANGCTATTSIFLPEPTGMVADFSPQGVFVGNYLCNGDPINLIVIGGTPSLNGMIGSGGSGVGFAPIGAPYYPLSAAHPLSSGGYIMDWSTGESTGGVTTLSAISPTQAGNYYVTITDGNACSVTASYTVLGLSNDCMYPGDANSDGVANNLDLLPIALHSGTQGALRHNATTQWTAQGGADWVGNITNTTINLRHADCDGNGAILANDTLVILQNYGQTHAKPATATVINAPPITCTFASDSLTNAVYPYILRSNVLVGDAVNPAADITGIAFTINYDASLASSAYLNLDNMSWLGAPNELYHIQHDNGQGRLDVAVSRFDGAVRGGFGKVATCNFVVIDNVIGKGVTAINYPFTVSVSGVKAINNANIDKPMNGKQSQIVVKNVVVGTNAVSLSRNIRVYPNPLRSNSLNISSTVGCGSISVSNALGQVVFAVQGNNQTELNLSLPELTDGIYTILIDTAEGKAAKKLVVTK